MDFALRLADWLRFIFLLRLAFEDLKTKTLRLQSLLLLFAASSAFAWISRAQGKYFEHRPYAFLLPVFLFVLVSAYEKMSKRFLLGGGDLFALASLAPALGLKDILLLLPLACLCSWPYLLLCYCSRRREAGNAFPLLPFYIPAFLLLRLRVL